jgi:hypothetical protein
MLNHHEIVFLASLLGHHTCGRIPNDHPMATIFEYASSYCERYGIDYKQLPLEVSDDGIYKDRVLIKLKEEINDK